MARITSMIFAFALAVPLGAGMASMSHAGVSGGTIATSSTADATITPVRFGGLRTAGGGFGDSIGSRNDRGGSFRRGSNSNGQNGSFSQLNPFGNDTSRRRGTVFDDSNSRSLTPGLRSPLRAGDVER